jgi:ribosomal protein L32
LKLTGAKSRFWEKLVYYSPPFVGTEEEKQRNKASHAWRTVRLSQRYAEASAKWDPVDECQNCKVLRGSQRSHYACGMAPTPEKFRE